MMPDMQGNVLKLMLVDGVARMTLQQQGYLYKLLPQDMEHARRERLIFKNHLTLP
jgi:hypothetical protein